MGRQGLPGRAEGGRDSARRAHPLGRRLLRRADGGAPVPQGDGLRRRDRPAAAGSGQGARPERRRQVHRAASDTAARSRDARAGDAAGVGAGGARPGDGRPATGLTPEPAKKNVFDDIALAHREIYALYEIAQAMGTSLGVADTMALISAKLSNLVPFSCAALFLYDEETRDAALPVCDRHRRRRSSSRSPCTAARAHRLGRAQPPRARQRAAERRPRSGRACRSCTRTCSRRSSARCCSTSGSSARCRSITSTPRFYRDDHRRLLDRVSEQAAAVINNSMLFEQTQEDSLTDPLTGLPNTRFLFMHLTRELARAERLKSEVSLLVMDLDNFKSINDSHGHHVGDRALCEVARVLRAAIRPVRHLRPLRRRRVHRRAVGLRRRRGRAASAAELQQSIDEVYLRSPSRQARAAGHQRRRGGLPARRRIVRSAARDGRQPDVPGQVAPEAPGGKATTAPPRASTRRRSSPSSPTLDIQTSRGAAIMLSAIVSDRGVADLRHPELVTNPRAGSGSDRFPAPRSIGGTSATIAAGRTRNTASRDPRRAASSCAATMRPRAPRQRGGHFPRGGQRQAPSRLAAPCRAVRRDTRNRAACGRCRAGGCRPALRDSTACLIIDRSGAMPVPPAMNRKRRSRGASGNMNDPDGPRTASRRRGEVARSASPQRPRLSVLIRNSRRPSRRGFFGGRRDRVGNAVVRRRRGRAPRPGRRGRESARRRDRDGRCASGRRAAHAADAQHEIRHDADLTDDPADASTSPAGTRSHTIVSAA